MREANWDEILSLRRDIREQKGKIARLRAIEKAARAAFDHHMLGYDPNGSTYDANVQIDLMNALGRALEEGK